LGFLVVVGVGGGGGPPHEAAPPCVIGMSAMASAVIQSITREGQNVP